MSAPGSLLEVADLLRKRLNLDRQLMAAEPQGMVSKPHVCWATDALSAYQDFLPQLLDEIEGRK